MTPRLSLARNSEPVLLTTVWTQLDSLELCRVLRAEGIEVDAVDLNRSGLVGYGTGSAAMGIELYVPTHALAAAKALVSGSAPVPAAVYDSGSGLARCPQHDVAFDQPCGRCGKLICPSCALTDGLCDACEVRSLSERAALSGGTHHGLRWVVRVILFAFIGLTVLGGVLTILGELLRHIRR